MKKQIGKTSIELKHKDTIKISHFNDLCSIMVIVGVVTLMYLFPIVKERVIVKVYQPKGWIERGYVVSPNYIITSKGERVKIEEGLAEGSYVYGIGVKEGVIKRLDYVGRE